ncbi:hypothetical protein A8F94_24055 [Bacillus sp. FJAT-27225]|nr:hypothetical protein A8F94_24055 [Bacillus sp. FJAT-27225]
MTLSELLRRVGLSCNDETIVVNGIESDSRKIKKGNLFVAIKGHDKDGHVYIDSAIENGAAAVIGEQELDSLPVPYYKVHNSRQIVSVLANTFYGHPQNKHIIVGITGTNGKTSTAYLLHHILSFNGKTSSLLGTVEYVFNGSRHESSLTTPDAVSLQKMIHESKDEFIIMEVSSHGLDQFRLAGPMLDYAIFTNLSHEHMDYHSDFEEYFQAKKKIFKCLKTGGKGIIGAYTPWGERMAEELAAEKVPSISYGNSNKKEAIYLKSFMTVPTLCLVIDDNGQEYSLTMRIPGKHNVYNALGSYICARAIGLTPQQIIRALECFQGVPGRFEQVDLPLGARAIVDYAHTPDGLIHALETASHCVENNLYHIFGFRGRRDPTKREEMVKISQAICSHVFLTLDDLNGVDKEQMVEELKELSKPYQNITVIEDRTEAIAHAMGSLGQGDGLIITGKGPEPYKDEYTYKTKSDIDTIYYFLTEGKIVEPING